MRAWAASAFRDMLQTIIRVDKPIILCSGARWPHKLARAPAPTLCAPETHPVYEIAFVAQGSLTLVLQNEAYRADAGSICVIQAREVHYETPFDPTVSYKVMWCQVFKSRLEIHAKGFSPREGYVRDGGTKTAWLGDNLESIIGVLVHEARRQVQFSDPLIRGYLLTLVSCICRQLEDTEEVVTLADTAEADVIIRDAVLYISRHYNTECTVNEVARFVAMSESKFYDYFKAKTRYSPYQFIQHVRLEKACQLLATRDWSVEHIANEVGYTAPYHFRLLFKRIYGTTPTGYRQKVRSTPVFSLDNR